MITDVSSSPEIVQYCQSSIFECVTSFNGSLTIIYFSYLEHLCTVIGVRT